MCSIQFAEKSAVGYGVVVEAGKESEQWKKNVSSGKLDEESGRLIEDFKEEEC